MGEVMVEYVVDRGKKKEVLLSVIKEIHFLKMGDLDIHQYKNNMSKIKITSWDQRRLNNESRTNLNEESLICEKSSCKNEEWDKVYKYKV